jgi:hypothetical protein
VQKIINITISTKSIEKQMRMGEKSNMMNSANHQTSKMNKGKESTHRLFKTARRKE